MATFSGVNLLSDQSASKKRPLEFSHSTTSQIVAKKRIILEDDEDLVTTKPMVTNPVQKIEQKPHNGAAVPPTTVKSEPVPKSNPTPTTRTTKPPQQPSNLKKENIQNGTTQPIKVEQKVSTTTTTSKPVVNAVTANGVSSQPLDRKPKEQSNNNNAHVSSQPQASVKAKIPPKKIEESEDDEDDDEEEEEDEEASNVSYDPSDNENDDEEDDEDDQMDEYDDSNEEYEEKEKVEDKPVKSKVDSKKVSSANASNGKPDSSKSRSPKVKKQASKRKSKKEESEDEDEDFSEQSSTEAIKKPSTSTTKPVVKRSESKDTDKKKSSSSSTKKASQQSEEGKKLKKPEDPESELLEWWKDPSSFQYKKGEKKWNTLKHNGVLFPELYKPHGVKMLYKGKPVDLTPEQEEVATMFAVMRESDYFHKKIFRDNFFEDWKGLLGKQHVIQSLEHCDFTPIWEWYLKEKEKKNNMTKEEKKALKEERAKIEAPYLFAYIDGRKEKVGNFRLEPPGLFRGRGEHPKMGKLKRRLQPEDITINIGHLKDTPKPPAGHHWKEVISDNTVTWLATWKNNVDGGVKYVMFAANSTLKTASDYAKYENARNLKEKVDLIRKTYKKHWDSEDLEDRQLGVAVYFIDKLALRVGNEKGEDEADTVGCCSLRVEHLQLLGDNKVRFDFLGKDSIRYTNEVVVENRVYENLKSFMKEKGPEDNLFEALTVGRLNKHLKSYMNSLTAKVFRTYNASVTLDRLLSVELDEKLSVNEKVEFYNKANKEVAILCNHQKTVSKSHNAQMQVIDEQIKDLQDHLSALQKALKDVKKKDYDVVVKEWERRQDSLEKKYDEVSQKYEEALKVYEQDKKQAKKDLVKPPKPPKFSRKKLGKDEKAIQGQIEDAQKKIKDVESKKRIRDENKSVALSTSKINYCDPRITIAWTKRNEVPIEKIFNKSLVKKFPWAMDVEEEFSF